MGTGAGLLSSGGSLVLSATIVADSASGNDCSGPVDDNEFNIDDDSSCLFTASSSTNDPLTLDGSLGPLKNNGGPTQTMALSGGPAVDQVEGADCPATDQPARARTAPCDIGAYDSTRRRSSKPSTSPSRAPRPSTAMSPPSPKPTTPPEG